MDPAAAPSAWGVRLAMATRGWISKTRLMHGMAPGEAFFQVWFERWDWHGRNCDRVTLHSGCAVPVHDVEASVRDMQSRIRRAAARAIDAWERFPDSIPQQQADGTLAEEPIGTRVIFREGWRPANCHPTERLPADVASFCDPPSDAMLAAALGLGSLGRDYEDAFTWMSRTPGERKTDRNWGLDIQVTPREWHGERLTPNRLKFGCDALAESVVGLFLDGTREAFAKLAEIYRPDGPGGALPPGFERLSDRIVAMEADERWKEVRQSVALGLHADDPSGEATRLLEKWRERRASSRTLSGRLAVPTVEEVAAAFRADSARPMNN